MNLAKLDLIKIYAHWSKYIILKNMKILILFLIRLPVFGENGEKVVVEVSGSDKKKDLITRCALEACKVLDEMDELFKIG